MALGRRTLTARNSLTLRAEAMEMIRSMIEKVVLTPFRAGFTR
jgi:hypothetical protein